MSSGNFFKILPCKLLSPYHVIKTASYQPLWLQMSSSNSFKMLPYTLLPPYSDFTNAIYQPSWWHMSSSNSFKMLPYKLLPPCPVMKHMKNSSCHNIKNKNCGNSLKWGSSFSDQFSITGSVWTLRILLARRGDPTADPQDVPIRKLWNHPSARFLPQPFKMLQRS